jgi:hypothetical protein
MGIRQLTVGAFYGNVSTHNKFLCMGILRELGLEARAAPATVSGVPASKTTG